MLNHTFIVKYITSRNCFLTLSEANIQKLSYHKIVKLQCGAKELYFSCIQGLRIKDNNVVGFPSSYAKVLGINDNESVYLSDVIRLPLLGQITISPVSFEDYEILQNASDRIQETMLDQVRVINKNQKLVIWISKWLYASVKIGNCFCGGIERNINQKLEKIFNSDNTYKY